MTLYWIFAQSPFLEWMINQDYVNLKELGQNVLSYLGALPGQHYFEHIRDCWGCSQYSHRHCDRSIFTVLYVKKDGHKATKCHRALSALKIIVMKGKILLEEETGKTLTDYIQGQLIELYVWEHYHILVISLLIYHMR